MDNVTTNSAIEGLGIPLAGLLVLFVSFVIGIGLFTFGQKRKRYNWSLIGIGFVIGAPAVLFFTSPTLQAQLTAAAAVASAILAGISINTVFQERHERKLREVVNWATELTSLALAGKLANPGRVNEPGIAYNFLRRGAGEESALRVLRARGVYAETLAAKTPQLTSRVNEIVETLESQIHLITQDLSTEFSDDNVAKALISMAKEVNANNNNLINAARELIEKASGLM